jgi:hypothetical protein
MYGLTFLTDIDKFEKPSSRVAEFGDTAVIIYNPYEFMHRFEESLFNQYGDNVNIRLDEVHYYPPNYYGDLDEFCKSDKYSWQNELRIRVALLDEHKSMVDNEGRTRKALVQNIDSIIINIGDIRDISIQIPVQDLISLKLPSIIEPPKRM